MKSKFVKTLLVSSLVAAIATGCGDDKDNNKSADTQAKDAGSLVFVDWGGTNTDARIEKNIKPVSYTHLDVYKRQPQYY